MPALCRLAEPIALTSVLPYYPAVLRSYHIPESDIAFWAGVCSAAYAVANAITALPWGWSSDYFGRKRMVIMGLLCNAFTALLWGFSVNLPMALVATGLTGAGNGNVGIQRTMIGEMSEGLTKAQEARMFSILPMMYNFGE
jgi:MFS family permease